MGIESDQLVFDYLSRVGDLAQQRQLTSGDRMRLVSTLRGEIDRQRARAVGGPDSTAAVQRILGRLGTPDEIVEAADGGGVEAVLSARASRRVLPRQRRTSSSAGGGGEDGRGDGRGDGRAEPGGSGQESTGHGSESGKSARASGGFGGFGGFRRGSGGSGRGPVGFDKESGGFEKEPDGPEKEPAGFDGATGPRAPFTPGPHLAGADELGPHEEDVDWWRDDPVPFGGLGTSTPPGFTGGVEIPDILKPPPQDEDADAEEGAAAPVRRWVPRRLRRRVPVVEAVDEPVVAVRGPLIPPGSFFLLVAALMLVVGAVLGNLLVLAGGWFLAYFSRRLTRTEAKWAVLGLPGLVAAGGAVWLWGRTEGRWGAPLSLQAEGALGDALTGMWPVLLRTAAVATALYLVWRARRIG